MALLSYFEDPLDYFRPTRLLHQHFGMGLDAEDLLSPILPRRHRRLLLSSPYTRPWRSMASRRDHGSTVSVDKDKFQVSLDVQQFAPEEITVKASGDNTITVEGKHEEREDEHGFISRHFVRKYTLPKGHNIERVQSKLSSDGVLTITAPKETVAQIEEREIPIAITGEPSRPINGAVEHDGGDQEMKSVEGKDKQNKNQGRRR